MHRIRIRIRSIDHLRRFVELNEEQTFAIDAEMGKNAIDAKSIMGLLAMDLSRPFTIVLYTDEREQKKYTRRLRTEIPEILA